MLDLSKASIMKRGTCLYGETKEYEVIIIESDVLYGSGDYEDPPEICDDRDTICYYVCFENLLEKGVFSAAGSSFMLLEDAIKDVEKTYSVDWIE